jgi:opacity protein-like surface antigen
MKKLTTATLAALALAATSFAGQEVSIDKDKNVVAPTGCFNDRELQLDVFGAYEVGLGPDHAGPIKDHAWGGGVGVNYFFTRYIGVGVDGAWVATHRNALQGGEETANNEVNGSLTFRYPIDRYCIAPYATLGGGAECNHGSFADFFLGVGLEYRIVPNKIGIFVDERWSYYGDYLSHDDQNHFQSRAGVRWVF